MTAQTGEKLIFNGKETQMTTEPLNQYLQNRNDIEFVWDSTACWRGYYGQWEIKDNKLYLIELEAYIEGGMVVDLNYLFPGKNKYLQIGSMEKLLFHRVKYWITYIWGMNLFMKRIYFLFLKMEY